MKNTLDTIIINFSKMVSLEITKEEIASLLHSVANDYSGYTTHWEITISAAEDFSNNIIHVLKEHTEEFVNREVLYAVALAAVDFHQNKVRRHCSDLADLMFDLGFFRDALYQCNSALSGYNSPASKLALLRQRRLIISKYKKSGKVDEEVEKRVKQLVDLTVHSAGREAINQILDPPKYIPWNTWYAQGQKHLPWDYSIIQARKELEEMGFNELEQNEKLNPAYAAIIKNLTIDRDKNARPGDTWWEKQLKKYEEVMK